MKFEKCEMISFVSHCSMNSINSKNSSLNSKEMSFRHVEMDSSSRDWQLIGRLGYAFIGNLKMRNARSGKCEKLSRINIKNS